MIARVTGIAIVVAIVLGTPPAHAKSPGQEALDAGVALYKQGRYREALGRFQEAVDRDPALMKAWENIGWAHHRLGEDGEALRIWSTVLKLEPDDVGAWNAVGEVHYSSEQYTEAARAFEKSLALRADQPDVRLRLGQSYDKTGRDDEAAAQYRALLNDRSTGAPAALRLADLEERHGRLDEAERVLRGALPERPEPGGPLADRLAHVIAARADASFKSEAWAEAADGYREASRLDPERVGYLVNLGWAQRKAGHDDDAIATWRQALDRGVQTPADLWRAVGDASRDAGRPSDATAAYARAAEVDPHSGAALYALAAISAQSGDVDGAVGSLRRLFATTDVDDTEAARAADLLIRAGGLTEGARLFQETGGGPARSHAAAVALARVRAAQGGEAYRAGDDVSASRFYEMALAADPRNRAALRDLGWARWRRQDWEGVRKTWTWYAAAYPDLAEPHELLGRLELQHGEPARAIEHAQRALALGGDAIGPDVLLTRAYLADGRFKHAREIAADLAKAHPDDPAVQTLYGDTLWRSLDFAAARDQWKRVLDLGATSPRAMHYWLRSMYETGDYDEAVAEATRLEASGQATEPVLRLLAEDAQVRADQAGTIHWYGELTQRFPQRIPYWVTLAEVHRDAADPAAERRVLEEAFARHPESNEIRLMLASSDLAAERPARALHEFETLGTTLGRNRSVFEGALDAEVALGRDRAAMDRLRADGAQYLDADERALAEASILEEQGRRVEAAQARRRVLEPRPGTVVLPILLYHGIADYPRTVNLPLDKFESQMQAIKDAGYQAITVSDLDLMWDGKAPFPDKPILITFDDARADSFRYADPVLARLGLRATMFVPTIRIADESAFNADWTTLAKLRASGRWDFQAHGHLAHDPIPVDAEGGLAEFLVNREWLVDDARLETRDEYAARVDGDYAECRERLAAHLPGQRVVAYAFPYSEMGQLHGGNESDALAVNEAAFRKRYRFGFVQDQAGYNTIVPGEATPRLLYRFAVPRTWDGERLLAQLAAEAPAQRARLDAVRADLWNGQLDGSEDALRAMIASEPKIQPEAGVDLARALHEQGRDVPAQQTIAALPTGPAWGNPDRSHRRLTRDVAWESDPQAGADVSLVSDSDGRDSVEAVASGRYPAWEPATLWASAGSVQFRDRALPTLSGFEGTAGVDWLAGRHVSGSAWLRGRSLTEGLRSVDGQATIAGRIDAHRFGLACGIVDVDTVGALQDGTQKRGCEGSYRANGRNWHVKARADYDDLTDGNRTWWLSADATTDVPRVRHLELGGGIEAADSRVDSPLYYAPQGLASALALARYAREFGKGSILEVEMGAGPSRDDQAGSRVVGRARAGWTQHWGPRWKTTLGFEYGATPNYHRTNAVFTFGYRF